MTIPHYGGPTAHLGMEKAGETFHHFNDVGNQKLITLRETITSPKDVKEPRLFGVVEASKMIGRSVPWLRDNITDVPVGDNGRKVYSLELIQQLREQLGTTFKKPAGHKAIVKAITNFKGGVGKTTSTVHEAHFMATVKAMKILVIDLDPQASCTFSLGPFIPDLELTQDDSIYNALLDNPNHNPIRGTYIPNIHIIPSNLSIQDLDLALPNGEINNTARMGSPLRRLATYIEPLRDFYDLILIDCPPNMGATTANALVACNAIMVPVPPASYDLASFVMFSNTIGNVFKGIDKKLEYARILITKHPGTQTARKVEADIRALYGDFVLSNHIVQTTEVEKACEQMTSIYDLDKPLSNRETYNRALNNFNSVFEEIFEDYVRVWETQEVNNG